MLRRVGSFFVPKLDLLGTPLATRAAGQSSSQVCVVACLGTRKFVGLGRPTNSQTRDFPSTEACRVRYPSTSPPDFLLCCDLALGRHPFARGHSELGNPQLERMLEGFCAAISWEASHVSPFGARRAVGEEHLLLPGEAIENTCGATSAKDQALASALRIRRMLAILSALSSGGFPDTCSRPTSCCRDCICLSQASLLATDVRHRNIGSSRLRPIDDVLVRNC